MNPVFSDKTKDLAPSAIREIFKSLTDPEMISFAAGNPSPQSFPVEKMSLISQDIFQNDYVNAFQYSVTEGYTPLRELVKKRLASKFGINYPDDELIITTGGQQGIDLTAKVLCNEHDVVITEDPSFIGALNAFRAYNTRLVGVENEKDGINVEKLEKAIIENPYCKLIYLIPTFQNPSGTTMSLEKRKKVLELAIKYDVVVIEDNPYGDLRYSGDYVPNIKSLDTDGIVIYAGSLSKLISPGMRVAYCICPKPIFQKLVVCKQGNDVHTNIWSQYVCNEFITKYDFNAHLARLREIYTKKAEFCMDLLDKYCAPAITYNRIDGGLFIWCDLPDSIDMPTFCKQAVENKICVVPGNAFLTHENEKCQSFRINFSTPTDKQLEKGIKILGALANN